MKKILLIAFLISCFFCGFSQGAKDSLYFDLINYKKEDTVKVMKFIDYGKSISAQNLDSAISLYNSAFSLSKKLNYHYGLAKSYYGLGNLNYNKGEFQQAVKMTTEALSLYKARQVEIEIANTLNLLGLINWSLGNYQTGIENHLEALKLREKNGDKKAIAFSLNNIGLIYWDLAQYDKALDYFFKCYELLSGFDEKRSMAIVLNNIGLIYTEKQDFVRALENHNKSLRLRTEIDDKGGILISLSNIGQTYFGLGDYTKALDFHLRSLKLKEEIGDRSGIAISYYNLAQSYFKLGKKDEAIKYYNLSVDLNAELGVKKGIMENYEGLYKLFKETQNYPSALEYHEKYTAIKDSILNETGIQSINEMQTKYETEKKEKEIELLNKDKDLQEAVINKERLFRNSVLLGLLLVSIMAFFIYSRYSIKRKANFALNQLNNELESLNKQLEKLSIVASHTDSGVMIFDNKYDIEWVNEGFTKLSGYTVQDVIKHGGNLRRISNYENIDAAIESCIVEKKPLIYESLNTMQNGNQVWTQSTLTPVLDENENLKKIVIIESDINKLKHAEEIIRKKNIAITDSIEYAKTIQDAILLPDSEVKQLLPESFILFKPKDVVSGDFYWVAPLNPPKGGNKLNITPSLSGRVGEGLLFAAVDCTGHGVPGAFMSLMGYNFMQNAVKENKIERASEILDLVNDEIIKMAQQQSGERTIKSGMDIALVMLDKANNKLQFSGAHNPLYLVRNEELIEIKGDKLSVGDCKNGEKFTNHEIEIKRGDTIYIFSDGFADQLGGPKRKKFYYQPFKELLQSISKIEMEEQKQILDARLTEWRGGIEQIDDVLVMGVKI